MRVLVTRPLEDARETEAQLNSRGHEAIVAPLLSVRFHDGPALDLTGVQAILATSANGVRALARRTQRRDLPVFAVGSATALSAKSAGFSDVRSADGDAGALARAVSACASAGNGDLLHASGVEGEGRLGNALTTIGFKVRTEFLYDVEAISALPKATKDEFLADRIDAVMLFSQRSAQVFATCVADAGLAVRLSNLLCLCISEATAKGLAPLNLSRVRIAEHPNQASLLDCLG